MSEDGIEMMMIGWRKHIGLINRQSGRDVQSKAINVLILDLEYQIDTLKNDQYIQ